MKTLQDLQNEEILRYIDGAVEALPKKLRELFVADLVRFSIDEDGNIGLKIQKELEDEKADELYIKISEYFEKNPSPQFEQVTVLH
jgi:hypothetical protein